MNEIELALLENAVGAPAYPHRGWCGWHCFVHAIGVFDPSMNFARDWSLIVAEHTLPIHGSFAEILAIVRDDTDWRAKHLVLKSSK